MRHSRHYLLLWFIALLSLFLNLILVVGLNNLRQDIRVELVRAAEGLEALNPPPFELPVAIDETVSMSLTVPFSDTFVVPIDATVPVDTQVPFEETIEVPIDTVIPIETSVAVELPLVGNVDVPIATTVPLELAVDVKISRTIPIELDLPVALDVAVPVQSEVPIRAEVPIQLDLPVEIPLDEMGLQPVLRSLEETLIGLADALGSGPLR